MSLENLFKEGRIEVRTTSRNEIHGLIKLAYRHITDASVVGLSPDGRFNHAYEGVLVLATVPLRCLGYRTKGIAHHSTIFEALPFVLGEEVDDLASYFQVCRRKRNQSSYFTPEVVSDGEADELIEESRKFAETILRWVEDNHPEYSFTPR